MLDPRTQENHGWIDNRMGPEFIQWYNQAREQLKGSQWESMFPDMYEQQFRANAWQSFLSWAFDDDQAETEWYNQRKNQLREQINGLLEEKRQQEYNSAAQQTQRLEAAGVNPNLQQGSASPGDSASVVDQTPGDQPSMAGQQPTVSETIGSLLSAVSIVKGGIEIGSAIEAFAHNRASNSMSELQEIMNTVPGVTNFLTSMSPSEDWTDPATGQLVAAGTPLQASQISAYIDSFGLRPTSNKLLKKLAGSVRYDKNGNPTSGYKAAMNKLLAGSLQDAQKAVGVMASPGYRDNIYAWSAAYNELIGTTNEEILKATQEASLNIARYDAKMHSNDIAQQTYDQLMAESASAEALAQFNEEYYNKLDPDARAGIENDDARTRYIQNQLSKMNSRIEQAYMKHFDDAIKQIKDMNLPPDEENALLSGVYSQRNAYLAQLARERQEALTKGSKVIGDTDWLNLGGDVIGGLSNLAGKVIPSIGKNTKRKSNYGSR